MLDEFRVFLKIEDVWRPLPRKYKSIKQAAIIADTIEGITGCEASVGVRLPVEDANIADCIIEIAEVDEPEEE